MNQTYPIGLSLLDFLPNVAFLIGAYYLVRWIKLLKGRFTLVAMVTGSTLVFLGGMLKAIWKLLYTLDIGDFIVLGEAQFVLLAPGFLLMLLSVLQVFRHDRHTPSSSLAVMAPWKIPLLAIMTLSSLGMQGLLSYIAFKRKVYLAGVMYIIAVLCMLSMAGMASGQQSVVMQWVEEGVNSFGQISFACGSYLIYKRYNADGDMMK